MPTHKVCLTRAVMTKNGKRKCYYQYGGRGAKYFYKAGSVASRTRAKNKARLQGRAINAHRH
jgi:hypothetical protein